MHAKDTQDTNRVQLWKLIFTYKIGPILLIKLSVAFYVNRNIAKVSFAKSSLIALIHKIKRYASN